MTTPLQLTAMAGILQNQGLAANAQMVGNIGVYETFTRGVIRSIRIGSLTDDDDQQNLSNATIGRLQTIGANVCVGLANGIPPGYSLTPSREQPGLTGLIRIGYNTVLPPVLNFFCQGFDMATGFVQSTNQVLSTARNSQTFLGPTFVGMNDLVTASISSLSTDLRRFGQDAAKLGTVIGLANLPELGSPAQLLKQLINSGGIPDGVNTLLDEQGILEKVRTLVSPDSEINDSDQARMYAAMQEVQGEDLKNVLEILDCSVSNLTTMADLLNPIKIFPNSFLTLTCPLPAGTQPIYLSGSPGNVIVTQTRRQVLNYTGSVNTDILPQLPEYLVDPTSSGMPYIRLRTIIPEDQALANKALQLSLQQIKGAEILTMSELGRAAGSLELNNDLPLINNLRQAVAPAIANTIISTVGKGTEPGGFLNVGDVIGTASGYNINRPLGNVLTIISQIPTGNLASIYSVMSNVISGDYGNIKGNIDIPPPLPGAGSYGNGDEAYANLCNIANSAIVSLRAAYPTQINSINSDWAMMANTVRNQNVNLVAATIDYVDMVSTQTAVYGFADSLGQYGQDEGASGAARYLESVVQINTTTGQAIIAAMREGRNDKVLEDSQLEAQNQIPR